MNDIADAIYNTPGLYLSPDDAQKAAQVIIAQSAKLETQLKCALVGEATWQAAAESWQKRADEAADRIEKLEAALREVEDALGYVKNEGKTLAIRESNAHSAWKIARAALAPETGK